jgi:hypothetical protein
MLFEFISNFLNLLVGISYSSSLLFKAFIVKLLAFEESCCLISCFCVGIHGSGLIFGWKFQAFSKII